jgi:hypothetical protein
MKLTGITIRLNSVVTAVAVGLAVVAASSPFFA